jgi:hypothetical protein
VVVRPEPPGQHTAHLLGLPEVSATAATREEALHQVQRMLAEWLTSGQLVPLELTQDNPWMKWFGWAKQDPDFDLYREEIRRGREQEDQQFFKEMDERECSNSSSTPIT